MAVMTAPPPGASAELIAKSGQAAGLEDITGQLRLEVAGAPVAVLKVADGAVEIAPGGDAAALLAVDTQATLLGVLSGKLHPFVAFLQGRLRIEGDRALALRILFGLQAPSPWSGLTPGS